MTDPLRFLVICLAVCVACGIIFLIVETIWFQTPALINEINIHKVSCLNLEEEQKRTQTLLAQIEQTRLRVQTLGNLLDRRVPNAAILKRLSDVMQNLDGTWIDILTIAPEPSKPGGRHFRLRMTLNCAAADQAECQAKFSIFVTDLNTAFAKFATQASEGEDRKSRGRENLKFQAVKLLSSAFGNLTVQVDDKRVKHSALKSEVEIPFQITPLPVD